MSSVPYMAREKNVRKNKFLESNIHYTFAAIQSAQA